jgi:hypothetical protein
LSDAEEVRCRLVEVVIGAVIGTAVNVISGTASIIAGTGEIEADASDGADDVRGVFVPLILLFRGCVAVGASICSGIGTMYAGLSSALTGGVGLS